jgi:hypothetical protein
MNPTLSPRLTSIRDELAESTARMHRIADPLDDATWRARPGDGRWGVAYSAIRIAAAHQRRHLWQAERVLESVARPAR